MAKPFDTFESPPRFTSRERWLLALILVAAAGLRFIGLSHHLRRGTGVFDEGNNFVAAVLGMWTMHSADPHVYSGYAGFFNWMLFLPMGLGERLYGEPGAFLAGRLLVAAFSVVNVLLMALVLKRRGGTAAALFGAALLAASRGEVSSAHYITADILVATAFLTLLLIRPHRGGRPSPTAATGVVLGLAVAIKYTALVLTPVAILETFREGGVRAVRRAAGFTLLAFALAAPFAVRGLLAQDDQGAGLLHAIRAYYGSAVSSGNHLGHFGEATATAHVNVGSLGLLLALLSPALARRRLDLVSPIALIIAAEVAMAPADVVYPRHGLPASAAFVLLAALAFDGLWKRFAVSWTVVAASAGLLIIQPLLAACAVTQGYLRPAEIDRAADWIEANVPAGRRIVTSLERFRLGDGYEVRFGPQVRHFPEAELAFFDVVVLVGPETTRLLTGCKEVARFSDVGNEGGALVIKAPCREKSARVRAPTDIFPEGTEAAWDPDPNTSARFGEGAIQFGARWQEPVEAAVIHLRVGDSRGEWPQRLQVSLLDKGGEWRLVDPTLLRPGQRRKQLPPFGQSYVLPEESGGVFGIRFERVRGGEFSVTDVAVYRPPGI
jgi:hypothetical protein